MSYFEAAKPKIRERGKDNERSSLREPSRNLVHESHVLEELCPMLYSIFPSEIFPSEFPPNFKPSQIAPKLIRLPKLLLIKC